MNPFKLDNRGISLVEILTSMAVASILMVGVMAFMNAGSTGYSSSSNQTVLQDDVQDILNYLHDITISSTDVYNYQNDGLDVLCILAPDNSQSSINDRYFVHYLCFDSSKNSLYYKKEADTKSNIKLANLTRQVSYLRNDANLLANNIIKFRTSIRRQTDFENASPTSLDDFSSGVNSEGATNNSVSIVSYSLTIKSAGDKTRTADIAVRPRNLMDPNFNLYDIFNP